MKQGINIITHPLFIIVFFCGLIISGEQMGGFYLLYILLGLPHLALHSVLGIAGIILLLAAYFNGPRQLCVSRLVAISCMAASLVCFFMQANGSYNYNTFHETLPLALLIIFCAIAIIFITINISCLLDVIRK
jgi:hypothetical protein